MSPALVSTVHVLIFYEFLQSWIILVLNIYLEYFNKQTENFQDGFKILVLILAFCFSFSTMLNKAWKKLLWM